MVAFHRTAAAPAAPRPSHSGCLGDQGGRGLCDYGAQLVVPPRFNRARHCFLGEIGSGLIITKLPCLGQEDT